MTSKASSLPDALSLRRSDLLRTQAFIDGRWCDDSEGRRFAVFDPATGEHILDVADCGAAMATAAVNAACRAADGWRGLTAKERSRLIRAWHDLVIAHREDLARLMSREQGKPLAEARGEVDYAAGYLEWFAEEAKRVYGEIVPSPVAGRELMVFQEPVGVVAVITPWNFPLAMIARKFAPALAAGCTVVAKPASETPLSALALIRLAEEAGIPAGVLNIVPTERVTEVSETWLNDSRVRKISFTGSTRVGKLLMRAGADTMKRMSLELGGDAPFLVFEDADLDRAVEGLIQAKFRNAGQACIAANRVYVHASVHDAFVARLVEAVGNLTVGAAADGPADIGPLIHDRATAAMAALVEDAMAGGARVLLGGQRHPLGGNFFAPTILTDVAAPMRLCAQEIFGPIIAISRFEDEDEAVRRANDTPYGLAAYLFSRDLLRIWRVMQRLETGLVGVNEGAISTEVAPFGGIKESGQGREGSRHGLADYITLKYICLGGLS